MADTRTEQDSMGSIEVPASALWGASTQRAIANFNIAGRPVRSEIIQAYGLIKGAAARVNAALGLLPDPLAVVIADAAAAIAEGQHAEHFPVDTLQTGSGTSTNMNVNEVIANLANRALGEALGTRHPVHPNDHVNLGQSSNDTFPSAIHIATALAVERTLRPALRDLRDVLNERSEAFMPVVKLGRTHLMDATPVRMGQVFSGYAAQIARADDRVDRMLSLCMELALGGTAVGTGINTDPRFAAGCCADLAERTGLRFTETTNHFAAQAAQDTAVEISGQLKTVAVALSRIANDIRWLASGPRGGIGELRLPALQPGSSIMPGKVNPVACESVMQACTRVAANDQNVTMGAFGGIGSVFELNLAMPSIADALLDSVQCVARAAETLSSQVLRGLEVDEQRCRTLLERSLMMVTRLVPEIGYDAAADVAKTALRDDLSIREVVLARGLLDADRLDELLNAADMT